MPQYNSFNGLGAKVNGLGSLLAIILAAVLLHGPVLAQELQPVEDTTGFGGPITSRSNAMLSVENALFTVDAETQWRFNKSPVTDIGLFDIGDIVLVRAVKTGETWTAREVHMVANLVSDEGVDDSVAPTPSGMFSGTLSALTASSLTVQETTLLIDDGTVWRAEGETVADTTLFDVGDVVMVQAELNGKTWTAKFVEMLANNVGDSGPAEPPMPVIVQDEEQPWSVTGTIQVFQPERMVLDTGTFAIGENTLWVMSDESLGLPEHFGIGDTVVVSARQEGELWVAERVTMLIDLEET